MPKLAASAVLAMVAAGAAAAQPPADIILRPGQAVPSPLHAAISAADIAAARAAWAKRVAAGAAAPQVAAPIMLSGKLLSTVVDIQHGPAAPAARITFQAPAGLWNIQVFYRSRTDAIVNQIYLVPGNDKTLTAGSVIIQQPGALGPYAEAGSWQLIGVEIWDLAGQDTEYVGGPLRKLLGGPGILTVKNTGTPDAGKPKVVGGTLLTPVVHLSGTDPYFRAHVDVSDALSGVASACVVVGPASGAFSECYTSDTPHPLRHGEVGVFNNVSNGGTGTWTIYAVDICNYSNHCGGIATPAEVQKIFGTTTFQVLP